MGPADTAFALEIAAVVTVAVLIVAIVAAASGACAARAAVRDVERALGAATLMTYAQAMKSGKAEECCAICLSEYAGGDELVRVVPACGHFFHAGCDVDRWLRARWTCPLCRGRLCQLPECPPIPPRAGGGGVAVDVMERVDLRS